MRVSRMVWHTAGEAFMKTKTIRIARVYLTKANHQT
jgi:hypothetical protein